MYFIKSTWDLEFNRDMEDEEIVSLYKDLINFTTYTNLNYLDKLLIKSDFVNEPERFFYTILYKLNSGLDSCQLFIYNFNQTERHLDSLFLILRTLISDTLMALYVINKETNSNKDIENNIKRLYSDHLKFSLKNLTKYGDKVWSYTALEIHQKQLKIKTDYKEYFLNNKLKYEPFRENIGEIASYLIKHHSNEISELLIVKGYDLYYFFSKYEHLGLLSFPLIHRQYDPKNKPAILRQIAEAFMVISCMIEYCLKHWKYLKVEEDIQFEVLLRRLLSHVPKNN
jgi:hypothetical protein